MTNHDAFLAEMNSWANRAHRTAPDAAAPPADLWDRILARANPQPKETTQMSSSTTTTIPAASIPPADVRSRQGIGHYANLAATIALVFAVAVAGWFATMQLNQTGSDDGRFAFLDSTPVVEQSATCDVEPLTVDEVMEIVRNPYSAFDPDLISSRDWQYFWEVNSGYDLLEAESLVVDQQLLDGFTSPASESTFDGAVSIADGFLACAQNGTIGHVFVYMDPKDVQRIVLSNHPVFRDEKTVRATVEEMISMPAMEIVFPGQEALHDTDLILTANPEIDDARVSYGTSATRYEATRAMMLGIVATDREGNVVYQSNAEGNASPEAGLDRQSRFRLILKQSSIDGQWYVLATWPDILYVS